jgi:hypothetical protein
VILLMTDVLNKINEMINGMTINQEVGLIVVGTLVVLCIVAIIALHYGDIVNYNYCMSHTRGVWIQTCESMKPTPLIFGW